jgi:lysophospholipase L1-like esterase
VQRIVVLGDSLTFGIAVDDGERFTDVLGRRFSGLEVINLGVTGYGTDQELRVLELEGFRYQPDIVMLVVTLSNDLQDIGYTRRDLPKPYYLLENGEPRLWKPRLTWDVRLRSASYLAEFLFQQMRDRVQVARWARVPGAGDPLPLFTALVQRMANESAQRGVHFFAVLAYSRHDLQTEPTEPERLAVTALGAAHIVMLDSYAPLAPRVRAGETLYLPEQPDAIHWNARGNAVISETIGRMLIRQGWLSSQVGTQIPSDDVAPRVDPEDLRNDRAREINRH